ncbi:MAG: sialate O-acetylesterase [Planctomycetaceae bacterium]|nr:sialate O-acetylesterase [Planctomycetaceae bacterium]
MNRLFCLLILAASSLRAEVKMPAIFSDGMVLQQLQLVRVWGTADAGEEVKLTFGDQSHSMLTASDEKWSVTLNPMNANATPTDLVVAGKNTITIRDVLVGEVWICSGQSNMQWTVKQAGNADAEIAGANHPLIRMFSVERNPSMTPQEDCKGTWKAATSANVGDFSAVGYFFGRHLHQVLKVPVGLINTSWGGTRIEAWTSREALEERPCANELLADWRDHTAQWDAAKAQAAFEKQKADWQAEVKKIDEANAKLPADQKKTKPRAPRPPEDPTKTPHHPSVLFNGMVAPLVPYGIKGAIWYQGESNASRAYQYRELFPAMISNWRDEWGQGDFPFYWVQLADFRDEKAEPVESDWAELREAQTMTMAKLPNTGEAVIIDIGEGKDIHPKNKVDVGHRLARWALARDYGISVPYRSPQYKSMKKDGGKITMSFEFVDGNGWRPFDVRNPVGFAIAGDDKKFVWADATILQDGRIEVSSKEVADPVAVRYAWADNPVCNMYDNAGLPLTPFRTDDWPGVTINNT